MIGKIFWTTRELAEATGLAQARIRQILIIGEEMQGIKQGRDWAVSDATAREWLRKRGIVVE